MTAGDIAWPVPKKIPIGHLANYGYEGTVLLPVPLTITPDFKPSLLGSDLQVKLKANWLVCRLECIPEDGEFALAMPARSTTALNARRLPGQLRGAAQAAGRREPGRRSKAMRSRSAWPACRPALRGKTLEFFPETGEVIETAAQWTQAWQGDVWTAQVPLSPQRAQQPGRDADGAGRRRPGLAHRGQGRRANGRPSPRRPACRRRWQAALRGNAGGGRRARPLPAPSLTLVAALLGALLGGLILNLMPCVFPILAIKVVGFTRHADDRRGHRIAGLAYTAGVVASFAALGALDAGLARRRRAARLGLPAAVARRWSRRWRRCSR